MPSDKQTTLKQLIGILAEAEVVTNAALAQISSLVQRAQAISEQTARERGHVEAFLDQFTLESSLSPTVSGQATFAGGVIADLDVMRADIATMALNASQASVLVNSLTSIKSTLSQGAAHFGSEVALNMTLDATQEHFRSAMNEAREEERRRMSREIHDGPAQVLANADYHVQIIEQVVKRNPDAITEELTRLRELLREGGMEIRQFMFDLRPSTLQDYGLGPSIKRYVTDRGSFFGRKFRCHVSEQLPKLTPDQDLALFRVVQEALQNAHKHAGNDAEVDVTIHATAENLILQIADNGQGFDQALVSPRLNSGVGLLGMRERASLARARIDIESRLNFGTTITLTLPLAAQTDLGNTRPPQGH